MVQSPQESLPSKQNSVQWIREKLRTLSGLGRSAFLYLLSDRVPQDALHDLEQGALTSAGSTTPPPQAPEQRNDKAMKNDTKVDKGDVKGGEAKDGTQKREEGKAPESKAA